jgi:hypothetical protein
LRYAARFASIRLASLTWRRCPSEHTYHDWVNLLAKWPQKIGEQAFALCDLHSITIPVLTEEIDGSAFMICPLISNQVAAGSLNLRIEGNILVKYDGTEIVRYFGLDREILVGRNVTVLEKSCFGRCKHLGQIDFEIGSELDRIGPAALRGCGWLPRIEIPASVQIIEEGSFEGCDALESCPMSKDSSVIGTSARAFRRCTSLRSFGVPSRVGEIGSNCFTQCLHLSRITFASSESLKRVISDHSLDDAWDRFGFRVTSSPFRVEVDHGGVELKFPGQVSVSGGDEDLHLTLIRDIQ